MATFYSSTSTGYNNGRKGFQLVLEITEVSTNSVTNTSDIAYKLFLHNPEGHYGLWKNTNLYVILKIGDNDLSRNSYGWYFGYNSSGNTTSIWSKTIFEGTTTVPHDKDGKLNLKVYASVPSMIDAIPEISLSGSTEVTDIVRTFIVTLDRQNNSYSRTTISVIEGSTYGTLPTPTKSGYTFEGWYTSAVGGTKITSNTEVITNSDHTLYAQYTTNKLTINYYSNNATECTFVGAQPVGEGRNVLVATEDRLYNQGEDTLWNYSSLGLSRIGYNSKTYWNTSPDGTGISVGQDDAYTGGEAWANAFGTSIRNGDATVDIYAQWSPIEYTVTYDTNGATFANIANQIFKFDELSSVPDCSNIKKEYTIEYNFNDDSKNKTTTTVSHTLLGWQYHNDIYPAGSQIKNLTTCGETELVLVAKWENNSTALMLPTRDDYKFLGWNTKEDGSGQYYRAGEKFNPTENISLYAQWEALAVIYCRYDNNSFIGGIPYVKLSNNLLKKAIGLYVKIDDEWKLSTISNNSYEIQYVQLVDSSGNQIYDSDGKAIYIKSISQTK